MPKYRFHFSRLAAIYLNADRIIEAPTEADAIEKAELLLETDNFDDAELGDTQDSGDNWNFDDPEEVDGDTPTTPLTPAAPQQKPPPS